MFGTPTNWIDGIITNYMDDISNQILLLLSSFSIHSGSMVELLSEILEHPWHQVYQHMYRIALQV